MRVRMWRSGGANRRPALTRGDDPLSRDLDAHARSLEALARAIRQDVARRTAGSSDAPVGEQRAHDELGRRLEDAAKVRPVDRPVET